MSRSNRVDQRLATGELIYNRETGRIVLPVWLEYSDALIDLEADSGWSKPMTIAGSSRQSAIALHAARAVVRPTGSR